MSGDFLDSNILVYAFDDVDAKKRRIARSVLSTGIGGKLVISVQVLVEFAAVMLHKVARPASPDAVMEALDAFTPIRLITPNAELVRRAIEARKAYGIHFYDGLIVAAAERAGCERILSEDFNTGQSYFGIEAVNPFA